MSEVNTFHITIKSPVHIGCGEDYEPTAFVIDEKRALLTSFDPLDFIASLSDADKDRLKGICKEGTADSLLEIYRFMRGKAYAGPSVDLCPGFLDHYKKTLSLKKGKDLRTELNRFAIARTAFDPYSNRPYIPGSAIKGALRTAWLNARQKELKIPKGKYVKSGDLEKNLLDGGSFDTDPLRMLKVSDFMPVGRVKTRIVYAVNEKKRSSDRAAQGPYQILEVIEPGSCFEGSITVDRPMEASGIKTPLTIDSLIHSMRSFYGNERIREETELSQIGITNRMEDFPDDAVPIRIGRHSGAESVTVEGHRSIKIMGKKGVSPDKHLQKSTTFWLAAEARESYLREHLLSFGWTCVKPGPAPAVETQSGTSPEEDAKSQDRPFERSASVHVPEKTPVEKIMDELKLIRHDDMGRIGTIIQKAESLLGDFEKASIAEAIRDKIGMKAYRKHKRHDLLESWLQGRGGRV